MQITAVLHLTRAGDIRNLSCLHLSTYGRPWEKCGGQTVTETPAMGGMSRIGGAELELLKFIAERHTVKVRDVVDFAAREKGLARTTVLTMLERLRKKGHLSRRKVEGVFQYEPRASKAEVL